MKLILTLLLLTFSLFANIQGTAYQVVHFYSAQVVHFSVARDTYGTLLRHTGSSDTPFLFTGEQYDPEAGLYYLRARYYSPELSRFLTRDTYEGTLADPLSQNPYLYARGNPVLYVDPSGRCFSVGGLSNSMAVMGILAGGTITSLSILNNNRGRYGGNVWATIGIYDIQSFLRAELLPSVWLIGEALTWQQEKLKNSRYRKHKNRCDRPPKKEDYSNDCAYYAALISHAESCVRAYESWDKAYNPGRHAKKIQQFKNTIKKFYKRSCR